MWFSDLDSMYFRKGKIKSNYKCLQNLYFVYLLIGIYWNSPKCALQFTVNVARAMYFYVYDETPISHDLLQCTIFLIRAKGSIHSASFSP
jgi:hypothetical protein